MKKSKGIRGIIRECIPLELYEVLRKNKCVCRYIECTYNYCKRIGDSRKYTNKKEELRVIRSIARQRAKSPTIAFNWLETPEGLHFWHKINEQYRIHLEEIK